MNTLQLGDVSLLEKEGGLGRYFSELLRHLPLTGTESSGLVVGKVSDAERSVSSFAATSEPLPARMLKVRRAALTRIDAGDIDLLAAHFAPYALPLLGRAKATPLVVHFHGPWAAESRAEEGAGLASRAKAGIERLVYGRASRIVVLSEYFKQELVRRYGVREEIVRVVPGGIDAHRFDVKISRAEARQKLDWPQDRTILLAVRRQVRRMGLEEMVDAMKILVVRHPQALFMLGGTGPISGELRERIHAQGLSEHVRQLGRVEDAVLPLAYRAADLSVVPSRALEGFGLVTLESLASGTPVFVTSVGGMPEVIRPFAPACVFEDASAAGMARQLGDAIAGAIDVPGEEACRAYAVDNFGWPHIASRVRAVYDEAVA